jgi:ATP-dependent helicase HrpA
MQNASNSEFEAIHKSILSGFLSNIAEKKEKNIFRAAKGREVMIFPGSGLFNKAGSWIVAAEIVETSRVFARTVANIDSSWLEKLGQDLCKRTYLHPRWDKIRGEVIASEQVSLFGLTIIPERIVSYGRINPDEASAIFLRSALIEGNLKRPFGFLQHNRRLIQSIKSWEDRIRRRDLLVSENVILDFYKERLNRVYDLRTLKKYLRDKRTDSFLRMKKEDLLLYHPEDAELEQYPEKISLGNHLFDSSYCFEPGKDHDGVTVKVPSELAPAVPAEAVDWLVPGLYKEKIATLIKGLPKSYRKKLVPINDSVEIISREMPQGDSALITALGEFIHRRFGVDIPAAAWSNEALPDYLKMRISITAPDGKELWAGRDAAILRQGADSSVKTDEFDAARRKWKKNGIVRWDFGDVPDSIGDSRGPKAKWIAYPALEKDPLTEKSVNLRLFRQRDNALDSHQKGVAALYAIHFAKDLKFLKRQLTLPADKSLMADYFGGAKRVEKRVLERVTQLLFCKNIRSEAAFYAHAEAVSPRIISTGREVLDTAVAVLTAYGEARKKISKLLEANHGNVPVVAFLCELMEELARLVPETFIDMYDLKRLAHLERYIKAVAIRAERALLDFEKDRAKSKEIKNFCSGLNKFLKNLSPSVSDKKRQALEEYFWMLEEYKVSVFAQELKTVGPISAKRLDQKLKQIERMV